jgi:hypothetical protein
VGGLCASGAPSALALTTPHLGLPADGLDDVGRVCPSALAGSADVRGVARGPGAFAQDATRLGGARCGERIVPPPLSTRVCRGGQAAVWPQRGGVIDAGEVPQRRDQRDGHRALSPASGLKRLDARVPAPRGPWCWECWGAMLQACGVGVDRAAVCRTDEWLGGGGTDHGRAPPEVGRAPGGTARLAAIVPQSAGVEPGCGGLEVPDRLVARPGASTDGVLVDVGDSARCEVT